MSSETIKSAGLSAAPKIDAILDAAVEVVAAPVETAAKPKLTKAEKVAAAKKSDEQIVSMSQSGGVTSKEVAAIRGTLRHGPYVRQLRRLVQDGKLRQTSLDRDGVPVYTFNEGGKPVVESKPEPKVKKVKKVKKASPVSSLEVEIVAPAAVPMTPEDALQAGEDLGRSLSNAISILQSFANGLKSTLG